MPRLESIVSFQADGKAFTACQSREGLDQVFARIDELNLRRATVRVSEDYAAGSLLPGS
jgi:hypothetical protein